MIMKDWDPSGKQGPRNPMPDVVVVHQPKDEEVPQDKGLKDKEGYVKDFAEPQMPIAPQQQQQAPPMEQPMQ